MACGRITTFVYSDTGPAGKTFVKPSIIITADNKLICVKVPALSEGLVKNLSIKQKSGSPVAFNFELLSSVIPYPVGEHANNYASNGIIDLYRIITPPGTNISAGAAFNLATEYEVGYPFRNLDGDYTNNQRYIYLVIIPANGAGAGSRWDAMVMVEGNTY